MRQPIVADHPRLLAVLDEWWGELGGEAGRLERALLMPRLFLQHFTDTSSSVERAGRSDRGLSHRLPVPVAL